MLLALALNIALASDGPAAASRAAPPLTPPALVHAEDPAYPADDQAKGVEGDVTLQVTVDANGDVSKAEVLDAPDDALAHAAVDAAHKLQFTPAMSGDKPVASIVRYTFQFRVPPRPPATNPSTSATTTTTTTTPTPTPTTTSTATAATNEATNGATNAATHANEQVASGGETTVTHRGTSAASADSVDGQDLKQRIVRTPADVLHAVPGLFTAQHQGGGKADQYFLRGFDADHGSDIDFSFDGVPINLPSNGHGQGYTDVHFVLPEVIDRIDFSKGPYFADKGDFDTAGAVDLHTNKTFAENVVDGSYGQFNTWRVAGVGTSGTGPNGGYVAGELYGSDGWSDKPEGLQRYSLMAKQNLQLSDAVALSVEGIAYSSQWNASGLIPERAVNAGTLDAFGSVDDAEGGQTQRFMVIANAHTKIAAGESFDVSLYAVRFQMRLFNDFTYDLVDPLHGDLVEQNDDRVYGGLIARYKKTFRLGDMLFATTFGAGGRLDAMNVSLFHDDHARRHLTSCEGLPLFCDDADVGQSNESAFVEENARLTEWLRIVAGVRGDLFTWNVTDKRPAPLAGSLPAAGIVEQAIVSPKLAVVLSPTDAWDVFVDAGSGFHSNDARSVIAKNGDGALPRAWGAEVGTRTKLFDAVTVSSSLWALYLDDEVAFDPDTDTTENNPATLRYGLDASARLSLFDDIVFGDVDLTVDHPQYLSVIDGGTDIELAPTQTLTAGISAIAPFGLRGRVDVREIADHPATPDGKKIAQGYAIVDVSAAYRWQFVEVSASIENVLDTPWKEAQFDYVSRLPGEPHAGVDGIDFTSGAPFNAQVGLALFF